MNSETTLWQNLEAGYRFILTLTDSAPLAHWTFVIATVVPAALVRYLHRFPCAARWSKLYGKPTVDWGIETLALLVGIALAYLPWQTLPGLIVGIVSGLLSPYVCKAAQAVGGVAFRWFEKRFGT